jgi:hypothetical protein
MDGTVSILNIESLRCRLLARQGHAGRVLLIYLQSGEQANFCAWNAVSGRLVCVWDTLTGTSMSIQTEHYEVSDDLVVHKHQKPCGDLQNMHIHNQASTQDFM